MNDAHVTWRAAVRRHYASIDGLDHLVEQMMGAHCLSLASIP